MKALRLDDIWVALSADMEKWFSDWQEIRKDLEKLLSLEYSGDMQTYLTHINELNSRVQVTGQTLK